MAEPLKSLPQPSAREPLHTRRYDFRGFRRADGLFDIEGRMVDTKDYAFPNDWRGTVAPGEAVHDMIIRLTLDDHFTVQDIAVVTAASPFEICGHITPAFHALKGATVAKGWSRTLRNQFSGTHGCTHHVEMLRAMGTVAFQTIYGYREKAKRDAGITKRDGPPADTTAGKRPGFIDTCHALASDGDVVRSHWPQFYQPPADGERDRAD
ncbi:DUF2889 domain-containing protein [Dongia rigui]|uniref:DUF2889 domain-containing protein n=1 Tax=Dongia rigui TaxID=940149 RepID=A0ABU5DZN4_9PROT|nr:DUF2889 domain-containing protein [Dongia rigui]MDY0872771.1 DUF2889 domain-containing protein [Dongia rigui]